jgi:dihydrolipoamide dehydrogenase
MEGNRVRVEFLRGDERGHDHFERLLAATGRRPNLDDLGLEHAGVPLDARGVPPSDPATAQVADTPVFIAGDAAARRMLLHDAADEGRIAGDNAGRWPDVREHIRSAPLAIAFTDPQLAVVGAGHAELTRAGIEFATGAVDFADQGRSRVMRRNRGLLHVYGEHGSGRFLGAELVAPAGEHLAHLLAWALQAGWTVQQTLDAPYYHPVIEEGVRTALRKLARALRMGPVPVKRCLDCGPGA